MCTRYRCGISNKLLIYALQVQPTVPKLFIYIFNLYGLQKIQLFRNICLHTPRTYLEFCILQICYHSVPLNYTSLKPI